MSEIISIYDELVPQSLQTKIFEFVDAPIWRYGWKSNTENDRFGFWHAHFAGGDGRSRKSCLDELQRNHAASPILELWNDLQIGLLRNHEPLRVYANAHTFGIEGYVHTDSNDEENYYTTIFYAHRVWRKNWSGELLFFSAEGDDVEKAVVPLPGRVVSFPGCVPHKASPPSRECPEVRISVVFKSQVRLSGVDDAKQR